MHRDIAEWQVTDAWQRQGLSELWIAVANYQCSASPPVAIIAITRTLMTNKMRCGAG
jgi:hypothetical protein